MMTSLLGRHGLIFLDPLDPELKRLAAPLYSEAARRAPEIATALEQRSSELESSWLSRAGPGDGKFVSAVSARRRGRRHAVARVENGKYKAKEIDDGILR